jgi:hypothetical protein
MPVKAVTALIVEARGLLEQNIDIARALVEALIEKGTLLTDEIDAIISTGIIARSLDKERKRRNDWREQEASAAALDCTQV